MPKYLLDTNACIGIRNSLRGVAAKDPVRREAQSCLVARLKATPANQLAMSVFTMGELMLWVEKHANPAQARQLTQQVAQQVRVLGCPACPEHGQASDELSSHYAAIRAELEADGEVIADNDLWIAAHARALNLTVVTNNTRHFGRVPGLAVEDWTA